MRLPTAPIRFDQNYQTRVNTAIEAEDLRNRKKGEDVEFVKDRLILRAPNGTRYVVTVSNTGALSAVAL